MKTPAELLAANWPAHLCTTFQQLRDADACVGGYGKLANFIRDHFAVTPKEFGMDRPIPVALILQSNGFDDALWTIRRAVPATPERDRFMHVLACDWAEHVLPIFEKHQPEDKRPRRAIEMARAFARGECTATELLESRRAASAAADAAADAADAADAAADAAYAAASAASAAASAASAASAAADARRAEEQWQSDRFAQALYEELGV